MTPREELISKIEKMSEEQIEAFLHLADVMISGRSEDSSVKYDPDNDPAIGLITHAIDFEAKDVKKILWAEFGINKSDESPK